MITVEADIIIEGGTFFSMAEGGSPLPASVAVNGGVVSAILPPRTQVEAKRRIDASGFFVAPGFVDSHMHDEYFRDADTVQRTLIRQGVTTAIGGHCGSGALFETALAARPRPWLHLGYMVGNCMLREAAGRTDRYSPSTERETGEMRDLLRQSLESGAMGLSLGLEYAPGASFFEISSLASVVAEIPDSFLSVHIRYDDKRCVGAVHEAIAIAREHKIRLQVSHLGSMTMNRTRECITVIETAAAEGLDVGFDCYPYDAFCAKAASAVYDDTFVERWEGKGPEYLEAASGRFRGQRLTFETLAVMRREEPTDLIIAYVMNQSEVDSCITHPECLIASDGLYSGGGAHPRIAGTFPKALRILRENGYSWWDALNKMTGKAADRLRINAGRIGDGSVADIVIFDPESLTDRATFSDPFLPPAGIEMVIINGKIVLEEGRLSDRACGDIIRRGYGNSGG